LEGKKCEVYSALFDVRFSKENNDNIIGFKAQLGHEKRQ